MALTIRADEKDPGGNKITVDRRLYLTSDGSRLVEEGDPAARLLFCTPGKRVLRSELEQLGVELDAGGKKRDKADTEDKRDKSGAEDKGDAGEGVPGNVKTAKRTIAGVEDLDELEALEALEAARDGGPRVGVTKAIEARRAEMEE